MCCGCYELFAVEDVYQLWIDEPDVVCPHCGATGTILEINDDSFALRVFVDVEYREV